MYSVKVNTIGQITMIYQDGFHEMLRQGSSTITRVSHIEPDQDGYWWVDLSPVDGPKLGPFSLRSDALIAEIQWLEKNLIEDQKKR